MASASRFDRLLGKLELDDARLRTSTVRESVASRPSQAGPVLLRAFRRETDEVRTAILEAFVETGRPEAVDLILLLYRSGLPQLPLKLGLALATRSGKLQHFRFVILSNPW